MIKCDVQNNLGYTNNDEIILVHDAYKKEICRLSNQHQTDLDCLEKFYKREFLYIIKEKNSNSFQLQTILQTLLVNFKNIKQNHTSMYSKMDTIDEMYQCILQSHKKKEKDLVDQILKLKEIVMEGKKRNVNISTTIILLKKENSLLKENLSHHHELSETLRSKTEFTIAVFSWCYNFSLLFIAAIVYYKKDNALKEHSVIWNLFGFILLVTMVWNSVRIVKKNTHILLNITFGIFCILNLLI